MRSCLQATTAAGLPLDTVQSCATALENAQRQAPNSLAVVQHPPEQGLALDNTLILPALLRGLSRIVKSACSTQQDVVFI